MSIFIPTKADPDLLRSLRDIEQQLNELKHESRTSAPTSIDDLISRLDAVESRLNGLSQFERVDQPFADYKNDGNPTRVLHEDGTWMEPLAGIAKAVPSGLDSDRTRPTNLINVLGSLAVTGALSADVVRARRSNIHVRSAMISRSTDLSVTANTPVTVTFDTVDWDTDRFWSSATPTRLTIPTGLGGYYMVRTAGHFTSVGANQWHMLRIEKNSGGTPTANNAIGELRTADVTASVWHQFLYTPVVYLAAGAYVETVVDSSHNDTLTAVTTTITKYPHFQIVYLGA